MRTAPAGSDEASRTGSAHWGPARVAEVLDALRHRQREVPAWVLAEARADGDEIVRHACAAVERALIADHLPELLRADVRVAVLVAPDAASAADPLLDALGELGTTVHAVAGDPTLDLALPSLPHPRLHVCTGNALGRFGTVGAVRLLRVVRATMTAADRLLLGLDLRRDRAVLEDEGHDAAGARAATHLGVLRLLNRELGADFDARQFAYTVRYDAELRRVDTSLVARRGLLVETARHGSIVLRQGESIRTTVDCKFDRGRVDAMLSGVGLRAASWWTDAAQRFALVLAVPAA